jgi:Vitamin K-dependent gamma-carboxylase
MEMNRHILDAWFRYDQFSFFFNLAPKQGDLGSRFLCLSILTCAVFAARFFLLAPHYTDALYLLFLLGIIAVVSGGGSFFLIFTEVDPQMTEDQKQAQRRRRQLLIQSSEWGAVTLRLQFAVVYFYYSMWKLHPDFLSGNILEGHLIGWDDQTASPSHFWKSRLDTFGHQLFQVMGLLGFLMDFGMFLVLTFRRPSDKTSRSFVLGSTAFHAVVAMTLGERIGYSFPIVCLAGILIFHPIGGGSTVGSDIDSANSQSPRVGPSLRYEQSESSCHQRSAAVYHWMVGSADLDSPKDALYFRRRIPFYVKRSSIFLDHGLAPATNIYQSHWQVHCESNSYGTSS